MIDFMIIGLPRSATTWAANWMTTEKVHCVHDPLYHTHYRNWDILSAKFDANKRVGVSCTGIWRWPQFVNSHKAMKLIVHRDLAQVNHELSKLGLPHIEANEAQKLNSLDGLHIKHTDLFDGNIAKDVWEHIVGSKFDKERHAALCEYHAQPFFQAIDPDPSVTRQLYNELSRM